MKNYLHGATLLLGLLIFRVATFLLFFWGQPFIDVFSDESAVLEAPSYVVDLDLPPKER